MTVLVGSDDVSLFVNALNVNTVAGARWIGMEYVAVESGTVDTLAYYANTAYGNTTDLILILASADGTVIGQTNPITYPGNIGAAFISAAIAGGGVAVVQGQTYFIGLYAIGGNGRTGTMASGFGNRIDDSSGSYASVPAQLAAISTDNGNANSLFYADGTVSGAGLAVTSVSGDNVVAAEEQNAAIVGVALDTVTVATHGGVNIFSGFSVTDATNATQDFSELPTAANSPVPHPGFGSRTYVLGDGTATSEIAVTQNIPTGFSAATVFTETPTNANSQVGAGLDLTETGPIELVAADDELILASVTNEDAGVSVNPVGVNGEFTLTGGSYDPALTYTFNAYLWDESRQELHFLTVTVRNQTVISLSLTSVSGDGTINVGETGAAIVGVGLDTVTAVTANGVNIFNGFASLNPMNALQDFSALPTAGVVPHEGPVVFDYVVGDGSVSDTLSVDGSADLAGHTPWSTYTAAPADVVAQIGARLSLTGGDVVSVGDIVALETTPAPNVAFSFTDTEGRFSLSGVGFDPEATYLVNGYLWDASRLEMWRVQFQILNNEIIGQVISSPENVNFGASFMLVSGGQLTIDAEPAVLPGVLYISPFGGITTRPNGRPICNAVLSGNDLVLDGTVFTGPSVLYVSPSRKITTTPNGPPVAELITGSGV